MTDRPPGEYPNIDAPGPNAEGEAARFRRRLMQA
jgi:hypothetical protein